MGVRYDPSVPQLPLWRMTRIDPVDPGGHIASMVRLVPVGAHVPPKAAARVTIIYVLPTVCMAVRNAGTARAAPGAETRQQQMLHQLS